MSFVVGIVFIAIGLTLLSQSWRGSQGRVPPGSVGPVAIALRTRVGPRKAAGRGDAALWSRATEAATIPLGVTAGCVALGGLAVIASGWDTIGRTAAAATLVVLIVGLAATWWAVLRAAGATKTGKPS